MYSGDAGGDDQLAEALRASVATYEEEESRRHNETCNTENDEKLARQLNEELNFDGGSQRSPYSYGVPYNPSPSSYQRHQHQFDFSNMPKTESYRDRRIVLLGMTGSGKSSTGNSIVGRTAFKASGLARSETSNCTYVSVELQGRTVLVVDTPGLFDTRQHNDETMREITRCVALSAPGPHALILVVEGGHRASAQTQECAKMILEVFGKQALRHMIILFTRLDDITYDGASLDDFVRSLPPNMKDALAKCGNRYVGFNNRTDSARMKNEQVEKFLALIDRVVDANGGRCFSNDVYKDFEKMIVAREEKIKEKHRMEKEKIEKEIKKDFEKQQQAQREYMEQERRKRLEEEEKHRANLKELEDRFNQKLEREKQQWAQREEENRKRIEEEARNKERQREFIEQENRKRLEEEERHKERLREIEDRRREMKREAELQEQKRHEMERRKEEQEMMRHREAEAKHRAELEEVKRRFNQRVYAARQEVREEIQQDEEGSSDLFNKLGKIVKKGIDAVTWVPRKVLSFFFG